MTNGSRKPQTPQPEDRERCEHEWDYSGQRISRFEHPNWQPNSIINRFRIERWDIYICYKCGEMIETQRVTIPPSYD